MLNAVSLFLTRSLLTANITSDLEYSKGGCTEPGQIVQYAGPFYCDKAHPVLR